MPPLSVQNFTLRKALRVIAVTILILFVITYIGYQSQNFIIGPSITLTETHTPIQHEKIIIIEGSTKNIVELTANGKEIHTDADGHFLHELVLENGYSITTFTAKDRFGRITTVEREYVYIPPTEDEV